MAALTGLMAGSLRALWPWKAGYNPRISSLENTGIGDNLLGVLAMALIGALTVWLLARLEAHIRASEGPRFFKRALGGRGSDL